MVRVHVRAPFHVGHDVTAASRPVTAPVRVQIPLANPIYDGPKLVGYLRHKEGVPSRAKTLSGPGSIPGWSASGRSRHLPIKFAEAQSS